MMDRARSLRAGVDHDRRAALGALMTSCATGIGLGGVLASGQVAVAVSSSPPVPGMGGVFHARAFGARGDGVADDTAAIKAALAACAAAGGGTVYFQPGKYVISSTIQVNDGRIVIQGAGWGSTIFSPRIESGDMFVFGDRAHAPERNKMADFSVRPSVPMTSGAAIHVQNGNGIILSDFEIDGGYHGVSIDDLGLQSGVHLRDFIIVNTRQAAIVIGQNSPLPFQPNEVFLTNGTISQCLIGLALVYVDGLYASAVSIYKSTSAGVLFGPSEKTVVSDSVFVNCITDSTVAGDGWCFTGAGVTTNIVLDNCITSFNHGNGVNIQPGARLDGLQVRGGIYQGCDFAGIIINSKQARNMLLQGVQVGFNGKAERGDRSGIQVASGVSDFTIDGCMIGAVGTFTSVARNLQAWGIVVAAGASDGYVITNNRAVGNLLGGIQDCGAGRNKTVLGNITRS